jgi:hypothetical protein
LNHPLEPSRSSSLAGTAGVIVALVAVAAMTTGVANARLIPAETRSTLGESQAVRAVAAAVAQAARELAGTERIVAAMPEQFTLAASSSNDNAVVAAADRVDPVVAHFVGERLLDLPPPGR